MARYVDGFVLAIPRRKSAEYRRIARLAAKVWREHGALEYVECMADDVKKGKLTSFPQAVKLKAGEAVWFSWITYKSRKHRDQVLAKVMKDKRLEKFMELGAMPFDTKRMIYGGFKAQVEL